MSSPEIEFFFSQSFHHILYLFYILGVTALEHQWHSNESDLEGGSKKVSIMHNIGYFILN